MAEPAPETEHFGLTRIAQGEGMSKNGFAFSDLDIMTIDRLLFALANHDHSGISRLSPPEILPSLTPLATGGTLPSDTTFYYRIAYCDRWGLETAASNEVQVTTAVGLTPPDPPALEVETTSGMLPAGLYSYVITYVTDDGGETTPSAPTDIRITDSGHPHTNRILIDLPDIPSEASSIRIYRAKPGQTRLYFLQEIDDVIAYDDGVVPEDPTLPAPRFNSSNSSNAVEVEIPSIPEGVFSWKIYRSTEPGVYDGFNLVHEVVEPTTETGNDLRTIWTDVGEVLEQGEPRFRSATLGTGLSGTELGGGGPGSGPAADAELRGSRLWSTVLPGQLEDREYNRTVFPNNLKPTSMTVFFPEPPILSGSEQVRVRILDERATPEYFQLTLGQVQSGDAFHQLTWPVVDTGFHEAEAGLRSAASPIVNDLSASNGQSVELPEEGDWVEVDWGVLEIGTYRPFVMMKVLSAQPATPATFRVEIIRTDTSTVLGSSTLTVDVVDEWQEWEAQQFTAPGNASVKFRVTKNDAIAMPHYVDSMRFQAIVPELLAGPISVEVETANLGATPTPGADAQVAVWF